MRVAFVTYDFTETGGQGRFSRDFISALRNQGVEADVISPVTTKSGRLARAATRLGKSPGFSFPANLLLRSLVKDHRHDLVHANGGPGGVFIPFSLSLPVVYTAHHTYAQQARLIGAQGWKSALALAEKRSYKRARAIAADTQSTADSLINEYSLLPQTVSVIPCGIDFEVFRPTFTAKAPRTCLFVGRLDARKGFSHLVQAWAQVVKRLPDSKLFVIGDGPERQASEKFLIDAGIRDTVSFLGRVDTQELVRRYSEAQCVAVPSVFEGFGLAALEALACGTRVVARNVEGLRDVVTGQGLGSLVAADDIAAFADAIIEEFERPSLVDSDTRAQLVEQYAWPIVVRRYVELYEATLRTAALRKSIAS